MTLSLFDDMKTDQFKKSTLAAEPNNVSKTYPQTIDVDSGTVASVLLQSLLCSDGE